MISHASCTTRRRAVLDLERCDGRGTYGFRRYDSQWFSISYISSLSVTFDYGNNRKVLYDMTQPFDPALY